MDQAHLGFRALADPTRRQILQMLSSNDMTIAEVADRFQMTRAAVKKHLSILAEGELIDVQTVGRTRLNRLRPEGLRKVVNWFSFFDAYWDDKLNTLKSEIEKDLS